MKSRAKIQMTPAGLRPCGACVHEGYEPKRKHCNLCQLMGLYTPKPEEAAERARRKGQNRKAREAALKKGGQE